MMVFTRALARDFKTLFGRCVAGRPRGPAPPLVVRIRGQVRTFAAITPDGVTLTHTAPAPGERDDVLILSAGILANVEAGSDDPVSVERQSKLRASLRWADRDGPHSTPADLILPGKPHELSAPPPLAPVGAVFLTALHECGRTAAKDSGRFALSKIQIQGKTGRMVGTDGKCALLWNGFTVPFPDQLLVPAIPVFGAKELARESTVRVGKTATHLVVSVGPWAVWLPTDSISRYPDVAGIIPRKGDATVAGIDERDAQILLGELARLPGAEQEYRPVTLDLDGGVKVRAAGSSTKAVREVYLARSPVAGSAVRVALDRTILKRILTLGCHTVRLVEGKPLVAEGENRTVLVATLDAALAVPPSDRAVRISTDDAPLNTTQPLSERNIPMKPLTTNGTSPNGRHESPPTDLPDALVAAEELRAALADAATKAARLVAALRHSREEKKALSVVFAGLKQLNLGTPGV